MPLEKPVLRIIDANANRAREGLRVLEDIARFVLDEGGLGARVKTCRHDVTRLVGELRTNENAQNITRDSESDVGRTVTAAAEENRREVYGILTANAHRVQEALRVLEEFSKLADRAVASQLKDLRYSVYTLEKEIADGLGQYGGSP